MKRITSSLVLCLLVSIYCKAQTEGFAYRTSLDTVKQSGFYNVAISPLVSAHTQTDYRDIRIVNTSGRWVPHLLRLPEEERTYHTLLMDMPFVSKKADATTVTCVVKNTFSAITQMVLQMKNTTAQRTCSISGSLNGKDWFIINDSIRLQEGAITSGNKTDCRLAFPPSDYPYFKIVVNSKQTDPVNIVSITTPISASKLLSEMTNKLLENPTCTTVQKDSAKVSYIQVTQQDAYQFEMLALQVSGVAYFNRRMDVYVPQTAQHSFTNLGRLVQSVNISNNSTLQFYLPLTKANTFYLVVHNDDNLPLKITVVKTALRYRVLTAYLEQGSGYQLITDNPNVAAPVYDLAKLKDSLPTNIPLLGMDSILTANSLTPTATIANKQSNKYLLWGSLALALLGLLYFTIKLTKEVNKRKATNAANEQQV